MTYIVHTFYRITVIALLLLPATLYAQNGSLDAEFTVEKRCHDFKLMPDVDTLKAGTGKAIKWRGTMGQKNPIDTPELLQGVYKFVFQQCGLNLIDSVHTSEGMAKLNDSVLTLTIFSSRYDTTLLTISFYHKHEELFFKTYVVLPAGPRPEAPCNCDGDTVTFSQRY